MRLRRCQSGFVSRCCRAAGWLRLGLALLAAGPALIAADVVLAATTPTAPAVSDVQVIAAYLVNFVRYVEWPAAIPPDGRPWQIGVLGSDALASSLERTAGGRLVRGHGIAVVRAKNVAAVRDCQVVLADPDRPSDLPAFLEAMAGRPVLTVVYRERSAAATGAAIELVLIDKHIRYFLATDVLAAQGLKPTPGLIENALSRSVAGGGMP